jgi:hypothetical protein
MGTTRNNLGEENMRVYVERFRRPYCKDEIV